MLYSTVAASVQFVHQCTYFGNSSSTNRIRVFKYNSAYPMFRYIIISVIVISVQETFVIIYFESFYRYLVVDILLVTSKDFTYLLTVINMQLAYIRYY